MRYISVKSIQSLSTDPFLPEDCTTICMFIAQEFCRVLHINKTMEVCPAYIHKVQLQNQITCRGVVRDFQADFTVGVKCHVAYFSNFYVVFHHVIWKFGKGETGCFHTLPGFLIHSLLIFYQCLL